MIPITRLNHLQLCIPVGAENEARKFYGELLGLKEIPKPEALKKNGGLWFKLLDIELHIGVEEVFPSKRHPSFEVKNIFSVHEWLRSKGVRVENNTAIPGWERFNAYDPFGNRLEFMEKQVELNEACSEFWEQFKKENTSYKNKSLTGKYHFCDNKKDANELAALVKSGRKTATCSLNLAYAIDKEEFPKADELFLITDFDSQPQCIIRNTKTFRQLYKNVDAEWAAMEGEGDLSLDYWRKVHWDFFSRALAPIGLAPTEEMELFCEVFERVDK